MKAALVPFVRDDGGVVGEREALATAMAHPGGTVVRRVRLRRWGTPQRCCV